MSTAPRKPAITPAPSSSPPDPAVEEEQITAGLAATLELAYGLQPGGIKRIPEGTATDNFTVTDQRGQRHFAKVYRTREPQALELELASIELSEYAADGGVPTARATRSLDHKFIATYGHMPMSLWSYVTHTETAEGTLAGARWASAGTAMGRLHNRLATYPAAPPSQAPGAAACDVGASRDRFNRLIHAYQHKPALGEFEAWALRATRDRQAIMADVEKTLASLPQLTVQTLHGDTAGPNVLFNDTEVAALVDFRPPATGYLAWEIARLGCDPKSVLDNSATDWLAGYTELTLAYREANPKASADDLLSSLRVGCAAMLCSAFPLSVPVERPHLVDAALEAYGHVRHEAALTLLDRLPGMEEALREALR